MKKFKLQCHYSILVTALLLFLLNGCSKDNPIEPGTFTDLDGNRYHTVTICDQIWMVENLNVSKYRNGDAIPQVKNKEDWRALTTGAYCYYNNDSGEYADKYGKLYNWYAVNDPRGLAPEGWHIPTDFEWSTLSTCLGGDDIAGGAMKEVGTNHWIYYNIGATNLSGFTGLPGGERNYLGYFEYIRYFGSWWSSTTDGTGDPSYRQLQKNEVNLFKFDKGDKGMGYSVRCLKD